MCGIAGVVSSDRGERTEALVRSMLAALSHRGPDDEGIAAVEGAAIGARRLAIIDLVTGHQPMMDESGAIVAVQNGEIYDFETVRDELIARGHRFRTASDTEVIPHAYEEWGTDFAQRLRGMFAVAIWDGNRRRVVLARDRFGKKPLVYAVVNGAFAFASEIQGLLAHPDIPRDVDETAIDLYLSLGYIPAPFTAFSAIRKLPPAHTLTFEDGTVHLRRYWKLSAYPKLRIPFADAAAELRARMDEAVRLRLISDVPLGVFLSGGLDSSTVVALMARHLPRVRTFSIGFADGRLNELPRARAVARAFGTEHEELVVDHQDVEMLPMLIRHVGEPFADSSIVPTYQVASLTRAHVTVALTGDGGDELFLGYDRYRAAVIAEGFRRIGRPAAATLARIGAALPTGHVAPPSLARTARFLAGLDVGGPDRYLRWSGYFVDDLRRAVLGPRLGPEDGVARALVRDAYDLEIEDEAERYAMADIALGLPGDLLAKMDIATMAASLEARAPLLDHRLAEFVARLPSSYKLSPSRSKIVLRAAMAGILPAETLGGGKRGFVAPVDRWLRGPLRQMFEDLVPQGEAVRRGWISRAGVERAYAAHQAGRSERTRHLWSLLVLEIWWREVADAASPLRSSA